MRGGGRVRPAAGFAALLLLTCIDVAVASSDEYGVPIEVKLWHTGRTPLAHMVDVTNGFGLKVLAEHNFLNDNNIAFSPYGLMGILVALFEGVDGESSYQIQMGMQLPWNRNIMRIGFRDIHRTLKTYFVPEEGFLAGLALNNENVTFNESYKKILRFYGFDLDNDQLPTLAPTNGTNVTTTAPPMGPGDNATTLAMTTENTPSTQAREETTPNPNAETISDIDIRIPTTTTISPSSAPNAESTTVNLNAPNTANQDPTVQATTTESVAQTATVSTLTTNSIDLTTTITATNAETTPATTSLATETETLSPLTSPTSTAALTDEPTVNNEVDVSTTPQMTNAVAVSTVADPTTGTTTTDNTRTQMTETLSEETLSAETLSTATLSTATLSTATLSTETQTTESSTNSMTETQQTDELSTSTTDMTTVPDISTTMLEDSTLETLERRKKSIVDFIFTSPPYVDDYLFYRSYDIPIPPESVTPNNFDNTMFLANGLRNVQVSYMHYDTILEHAYLPHLEASALRLPLDSERYYLLVVLPSRRGVSELGRLLSRMARESDLSDVYAALRPRRVRAIVPSFTVKGHVTLTTDLQKLGVRDVFEPRQRDFTPMTRQAGVYVRSIEQAVSVAIRKYQPDDNKRNRYVTSRQPVAFSATYPFLYFVMDSSVHVALMAGKMVDPLNTRIL